LLFTHISYAAAATFSPATPPPRSSFADTAAASRFRRFRCFASRFFRPRRQPAGRRFQLASFRCRRQASLPRLHDTVFDEFRRASIAAFIFAAATVSSRAK